MKIDFQNDVHGQMKIDFEGETPTFVALWRFIADGFDRKCDFTAYYHLRGFHDLVQSNGTSFPEINFAEDKLANAAIRLEMLDTHMILDIYVDFAEKFPQSECRTLVLNDRLYNLSNNEHHGFYEVEDIGNPIVGNLLNQIASTYDNAVIYYKMATDAIPVGILQDHAWVRRILHTDHKLLRLLFRPQYSNDDTPAFIFIIE